MKESDTQNSRRMTLSNLHLIHVTNPTLSQQTLVPVILIDMTKVKVKDVTLTRPRTTTWLTSGQNKRKQSKTRGVVL